MDREVRHLLPPHGNFPTLAAYLRFTLEHLRNWLCDESEQKGDENKISVMTHRKPRPTFLSEFSVYRRVLAKDTHQTRFFREATKPAANPEGAQVPSVRSDPESYCRCSQWQSTTDSAP